MAADDVRSVIRSALADIAPEADLDALPGDADLQEELDLDSMDFLNLVIALGERTGVEIPEHDYAAIATFDGCAAYLRART